MAIRFEDNIGTIKGNTMSVTDLTVTANISAMGSVYSKKASEGGIGWHNTDAIPGVIWRFKDRLFVGDAADFTGNQATGTSYGTSWAMSSAATYFYLNSVFAAAGASQARGGAGPSSAGIMGISKWMGVGAVAVNDGTDYDYARGLYVEGMHYNADTGATTAAEFQVGNYNGTEMPVAHAYNMGGSRVNAVYIGAESGRGYRQGTVAPGSEIITPTQPCGAAIDISGGSLGASYQKFVTGIVFRNGGLYRDPITNTATAISLARQHEIIWGGGTNFPRFGFITCSVSSSATTTGIILQNRGTLFVGTNIEGADNKILETFDTTSFNLVSAANYVRIANAAAGDGVTISSQGTDTNIDLKLSPKGTGSVVPAVNNSYTLGSSSSLWSSIYAVNGTINTSDQRDKTNIQPTPLGLNFINNLNPVSYKWTVGSNKILSVDEQGNAVIEQIPGQRTHHGLLAQEVKAALPESIDFGGWVLTDKNDPNSQQALRYDQFIAPMIKAIQELSAEVQTLKAQLSATN